VTSLLYVLIYDEVGAKYSIKLTIKNSVEIKEENVGLIS
jgi:hypothetical protein